VTAESFVVTGGNGGGPGDAGDLHVTGDLQVDGTAEFATVQRFKADGTMQIGDVDGGTDTANIVLNPDGSADFGGDITAPRYKFPNVSGYISGSGGLNSNYVWLGTDSTHSIKLDIITRILFPGKQTFAFLVNKNLLKEQSLLKIAGPQ
jgi:hypothetical protein